MNNPKLELQNIPYEEIKTGDVVSFERFISEADVRGFADLTGDKNPLHVNAEYAVSTELKEPIVHGMFLGSLFSALVGMLYPGKSCLYISQELNFKKPISWNSNVKVEGVVISKSDALKIVELKTTVYLNDVSCVEGRARVKVRS